MQVLEPRDVIDLGIDDDPLGERLLSIYLTLKGS